MLKIYGVPISVHARKVIVVSRLKALPYELVPVAPVIPGSLPPNWRELSPTGLIPVMQDGDFTLADSSAICVYLERMHPQPSVYPSAPRDHASALWLEQYAGGTLFRQIVHPLFHETVVNPNILQQPTNPHRVDEVVTRAMPEVFGYLDSVCGGAHLAGPVLSVADIAVASNLVTLQYLGFMLDRSRFAKLAGLLDRTIRHPAFIEALRAEQPAVQQMGLRGDFLKPVLA
ncbi:glutathione S-transferase family protein [Aquabacterium sp. A7-Y]|uniref:glutathione S-transferase family protein n=1 Tax=Aquabacterium sp. A7-Y TaxID=1349605 RepID=UPI00223D9044|nr:glutathione S-transferase family protein [Aquabacterium sp. A7-Y]MCW7541405.1 glutathione S-transferase family protein [Aquabacterium sp. A7-Y]